MAISEVFSGTTATISSTEYYLASASTTPTWQTADGVYQCWIDLGALVAGDIFRVACYERVLSGDVAEEVFIQNVTGPNDAPHLVTPSLILMHGWEFSILKISGTDRAFPYSIRQIA